MRRIPNKIEIKNLLKEKENYQIEFMSAKELMNSGNQGDYKIAKELVGFANRSGGLLVFGVDDQTRNIESIHIREEEALSKLSEISRVKCSPDIQFEHKYYTYDESSEQNKEVLIVRVNPAGQIPAAIIDDNSGIQKREYRLRTGNKSRAVTDHELNQLFTSTNSKNLTYVCNTWITYDHSTTNLYDINDKKKIYPNITYRSEELLPKSNFRLNYFLTQLPTHAELKEILKSEDEHRSGSKPIAELAIDIAPLAFVYDLREKFWKSWTSETQSKNDENLIERDDVDDSRVIKKSNVIIQGEGLQIPNLNTNPLDAAFDHGIAESWMSTQSIVLPPGSHFIISFSDQVEESTFRTPISRITIECDELFTVEIEFKLRRFGSGNPRRYPLNSQSDSEEYIELSVDFSMELNHPDVSGPYYEEHSNFARTIENIIKEDWDSPRYVEENKENILFSIYNQMDEIDNKLDEDIEEKIVVLLRKLSDFEV